MSTGKWLTSLLALSLSLPALADEVSDAIAFRQIFLNEVSALHPTATASDVEVLHFIPDAAVVKTLRANTLAEALNSLRNSNILSLVENTKSMAAPNVAVKVPSVNSDLTIVLVPGVFAEFIANRAFEEIFEQKSTVREQFKNLLASQHVMDSVSLLENYRKDRPGNEVAKGEERTLDQVINVGEMEIGGKTVRVILFFTEFSTLESLGENVDRAKIFNRRLEKYLELTGSQNLAFVGYSRGTPLALEMLAQAKAAGRPWVEKVQAMVSLSGVNWGSSLADSAYYDTTSPMHKILMDLDSTAKSLQFIDASQSKLSAKNWPILVGNAKKWAAFGVSAVENYRLMNADKTSPHSVSAIGSLIQTDPRSPLSIALRMWQKLGLGHPLDDYNANIIRFAYFVDQLLASVKELGTKDRIAWWTEHDIPLGPTYYALTATMANPDADADQLKMFMNPLSYGGKGNYDDTNLLQNTLDYIKITKPSANEPGISLNDSQVSVGQAAFLPGVIAGLRPSNAGVKTKFLGTVSTHHWGIALRVVNKKLISGGQNGFPREALLRALATQVLSDMN